jgi:hypothetical protein
MMKRMFHEEPYACGVYGRLPVDYIPQQIEIGWVNVDGM